MSGIAPRKREVALAEAVVVEGVVEEPTNITRIVANVIDFGATPEESSADDTQAFLDAIAYAGTQVSATNPGVIYIPEGIYDINEQLHIKIKQIQSYA